MAAASRRQRKGNRLGDSLGSGTGPGVREQEQCKKEVRSQGQSPSGSFRRRQLNAEKDRTSVGEPTTEALRRTYSRYF